MKTLSYKGYVGSIEISDEDNCLYGKVLDLPKDTMISYEGNTVSELKEDFMGAVDDYLAYCKEEGITPRKSYSGSLNIRISPEIHSKIAILACSELHAFFMRINKKMPAFFGYYKKIL